MTSWFHKFDRLWFLTWTTYGTWLPGDDRGFVSPKFEQEVTEKRNNVLGTEYDDGRANLNHLAAENLKCPPILLSNEQANVLREQFEETAKYRQWTLVAGAIMRSHIHLLIGVFGDPPSENILRDFKSYGSRCLNQKFGANKSGTWWTEQGSKRKVRDESHCGNVIEYIRRQHECLVLWGEAFDEKARGV